MTGAPEQPPQTTAPHDAASTPRDVLHSITLRHLLDALEGVAYVTDRDGRIAAVSQPAWQHFADDNATPWLTADAVVGTSLFDTILGDDVRTSYQRMHGAVVMGRRPEVVFEYRCDSPIAERHMRMAITPIVARGEVAAVLYQSQMLAEVRRLPMPLFSSDLRASMTRPPPPDKVVTVCSFCQRVSWPPGPLGRGSHWISAPDFYRHGGPDDAMVSDGVCQDCQRRVVSPNA